MLVTRNNYKRPPGEKNSGKTLVETAGYITTQQRIENMMLAGQRLEDWRKQNYDSDTLEEGIDDDNIPLDPTRSPAFDLADASQIIMETEEKLKIAKAEADEKRLENATKELPEDKNTGKESVKKSEEEE